jgi:hypothetical protein
VQSVLLAGIVNAIAHQFYSKNFTLLISQEKFMPGKPSLLRKSHFLGTKIRRLRKRNHLTLEDLSVRCIQLDRENAPSVSYLSMIEDIAIDPEPESGGIRGMPLEPGFLFSNELLQTAIPELLSQTGTTGRQFAHLLIRAHQESNQNRFPDLERAAESIGKKQFPLSVDDMFDLVAGLGLKIRWFERPSFKDKGDTERPLDTLVRSFYEAPDIVFLNKLLREMPERLKYDLANHIAHRVLHGGDGARAPQISGGRVSGRRHDAESPNIDAKDILYDRFGSFLRATRMPSIRAARSGCRQR